MENTKVIYEILKDKSRGQLNEGDVLKIYKGRHEGVNIYGYYIFLKRVSRNNIEVNYYYEFTDEMLPSHLMDGVQLLAISENYKQRWNLGDYLGDGIVVMVKYNKFTKSWLYFGV